MLISLCFLKLVLKIILLNHLNSEAGIDQLFFNQMLMDSIRILQAPVAQFFDYLFCSREWCERLTLIFLPKLHLLEGHAADFMQRCLTGLEISGEQGAEFIHNVFNILRCTYSSIQPASKCLESMMNEHFRLVHPDAMSLKPEIKRRKRS